MRSLVLSLIAVSAIACKTSSVPLSGDDLGGAGAVGGGGSGSGADLAVDPNACNEPDGNVVVLAEQLSLAKMLLPGRWRLCSRSSDSFGPWNPPSLGGIEFVEDDSVTPAQAGGGRWYFLELAADGTLQRGTGFDGGGTFLYNPFPTNDAEQISLSAGGTYADFMAAFLDSPRKMRMLGPSSFSAVFAPLAE